MSTKGQTFKPEPLTSQEVDQLLAGCSLRAPTGIRNRALIMLLYRSGLRISEALALRPANIDLERHSARVLHGKGDKATVRPLHPSATVSLARWLDRRAQLGLRNGLLFCTLQGGPLASGYIRDLLKRLARKAGIGKRVHPHGLRHTYANELPGRCRHRDHLQGARPRVDRHHGALPRPSHQRPGRRRRRTAAATRGVGMMTRRTYKIAVFEIAMSVRYPHWADVMPCGQT
jgi:integrase